MTLYLEKEVLAEIHEHAREAYPRECCGCLIGTREGDRFRAHSAVRAKNLAPETVRDRYQMDPVSRLEAERKAEASSLSVVGFYHSHPDHDAYFSRTDLECSEEYLLGEPWVPPAYAYLVVSVRQGKPAGHAAFVVSNGASVSVNTVV